MATPFALSIESRPREVKLVEFRDEASILLKLFIETPPLELAELKMISPETFALRSSPADSDTAPELRKTIPS